MDSDREFDELRALARMLLSAQRNSHDLPLPNQIILAEQLRYCFYKLTKFSCPKSWSEADTASVYLLEMLQPELKFSVSNDRIRHKLCECISDEERNKNLRLAYTISSALQQDTTNMEQQLEMFSEQSDATLFPCASDNILECAIMEQQNQAQNDDLLSIAMCNADLTDAVTVDEVEALMIPELDSDDEERPELPNTLVDVSYMVKLPNGEEMPPDINTNEFLSIILKARQDNLITPESKMCDKDAQKIRHASKLKGIACIEEDHGQLTILRPGRQILQLGYSETKDFTTFIKNLDGIKTKQDLYEHLCLYYWFKNVIKNKLFHTNHWLECPVILSRGDNSLQAKALRAIPVTLDRYCQRMI